MSYTLEKIRRLGSRHYFFLMLVKLQVKANKCDSREIIFCCIMISEMMSLRHLFLLHFLCLKNIELLV